MRPDNSSFYQVHVQARDWLSENTFELKLEKPDTFSYQPGQKILCSRGGLAREYTLVSSSSDDFLTICIRCLKGGVFSSYLAELGLGEAISISKPYGFFFYQGGKTVFVATGTGIAPFVAFAKAGVRDFILLHGVKNARELYYRDILANAARQYIPCLSSCDDPVAHIQNPFKGRVTTYIERNLPKGQYDFYLSGNGVMIRDATFIIDRMFSGSRIFVENFFSS